MFSTYMAGEFWDFEEDSYALELHNSSFAGGSRVILEGRLSRTSALKGSVLSMATAFILLLLLFFVLKTGPLTLPMGLIGVIGGFFYSSKPIRWVSRGIGEIWIGFNYGWLPVASSYYILTGKINPAINLIPLPIAISIVNVILLNEFPDYLADKKAGKTNLLVRLGREKGALVYLILTVGEVIFFILSVYLLEGVKWWLYLPVLTVSSYLALKMVKGGYKSGDLERFLGLNIFVNLGITLVYIVSFW